MPFFEWNESYSVQVSTMDAEHKRLIALADRLHAAMKKGQGNSVVEEILSSLIDYTVYHFSSEEKLMLTHGYPGFDSHKRLHTDLISKVKEKQAELISGKTMLSVSLMDFLKSWLVNHIQGEDRKYGAFLASKGIQ